MIQSHLLTWKMARKFLLRSMPMTKIENFTSLTCLNSWHLVKIMKKYPSLNTQSCIKGLLMVQDFSFWVVTSLGSRASIEKKILGRLWATFEGNFSCFQGQKTCCSVRAEKMHKVKLKEMKRNLIFFCFFVFFYWLWILKLGCAT